MDAQGCIGFTIYFYLCQKAYGSNGYFYPWCFDDAATTARKVGGGAGANSVEETVKLCFRVGLLDGELYDRWQILTSKGIQRRYAQVALTRTCRSVISEYWLLSESECRGLVKVAISQADKSIMPPHNSIMTPHNTYFSDSKGKESKGKESKGNGRRACAREEPAPSPMGYYEQFVSSTISGTIKASMDDFADRLGAEVVIRAMDEAIANNKHSWSYIRAILNRWEADGIRTIGDIDTMKAERDEKKRKGAKKDAPELPPNPNRF